MTRVPGSSVESTSLTPTQTDNSTPTDTPVGGFRVSEYMGTRWFYAQTNANQTNGSLQARQLAKIAARLAALKRRIAARRQRRGLRGGGGDDDDFDADFLDGTHNEHRRAEAGGGAGGGGGGGGSGQQSHDDEHSGSWSGESSSKVDIKAQHIRPVRDPAPGALIARVAAQDSIGSVRPEQIADEWCASLVSLRDKLAVDPHYRLDVEYFDLLLDLLHTKEHLGPLKPQGMSAWREKLRVLFGKRAEKPSPSGSVSTTPDPAAVPASRRELTRLEGFHALLPLIAMRHDARDVPSRLNQSKNTATTARNAALARQSKR